MRGNLGKSRRHDRREISAPTSGAKTVMVGERRCTLGIACIRPGAWAPTVSIDPSQPGEKRQVLTSTPDQLRPTAAEAMAEAQRMAERFMNPSVNDPIIASALAMIGSPETLRRA
jgi:hypothetical protein